MEDETENLTVKKSIGRRHSAPETAVFNSSIRICRNQRGRRNVWCTASVSDFSILLEHHSESGSSLELDTSNLSRDLTPDPTLKSSLAGSYQNLHAIHDEIQPGTFEVASFWTVLSSWLTWRNIILSQAVSGFLAVVVASNNAIGRFPNPSLNGQNLLHYVLLSGLWTTKLALRNNGRNLVEIIKFSGLRYLCLSTLHVEVNYLLLSSFRHDTYMGNQTIDCVAAILSLIVAYVLLEVRFHPIHVSGFALTILGGFGLSITNSVLKNQTHGQGPLGDVLRIASGVCLAYNSMTQEIIVKATDHVEYLGMIGLMGSLICGFQVLIAERHKILPKNCLFWWNLLIYSAAQFSFQSLTPKILRDAGATGFHLALISSGFYSQLVQFIFEGNEFRFFHVASYAAAIIGSSLFAIRKASIGTPYCFPVKFVPTKS